MSSCNTTNEFWELFDRRTENQFLEFFGPDKDIFPKNPADHRSSLTRNKRKRDIHDNSQNQMKKKVKQDEYIKRNISHKTEPLQKIEEQTKTKQRKETLDERLVRLFGSPELKSDRKKDSDLQRTTSSNIPSSLTKPVNIGHKSKPLQKITEKPKTNQREETLNERLVRLFGSPTRDDLQETTRNKIPSSLTLKRKYRVKKLVIRPVSTKY